MANRRDMEQRQLAATGMGAEEARRVAPSMAAPEANGDAPLTENGELQAECFGAYWDPILEGMARSGKLHVFCSPMQRNLQTVAPLMRRLHAKGIALNAEVRPDNCEVPGNVHTVDQAVAANIGALKDTDPTAAAELLESHDWHPAGLSVDEIVTMFPWAEPQIDGDFPADASQGWCKGPEWQWDDLREGAAHCTKTAEKRFSRVADWVYTLCDALPVDDVCVCITHGGMQNRLVNELLHRAYGHGADLTGQVLGLHPNSNTSTSCITINPAGTEPRFRLEFWHRLDHLAAGTTPDTLRRGYMHLGWVKPTEEDGPVGSWGLKATPGFAALVASKL